jgi:DNA-directed RNA polymerase specialized sigma subunit
MNCRRIGSLPREFDVLSREKILSLLVERIARLPSTPKKVLAMYYYENLQPAEIAACLGLSEHDTELIRAQTVRLLETDLFRDRAQSKSLGWTPLDTLGSRSPHPWLDG